ncbi:MAG: polysaccharide biosynthesis tyrosine autokinase [Planctomycetes bacterium]|nr:polysaccharide biosynthesis tyrosine autokinase [Planctomycetota bacterium]MBL7143377.1 polysaccharide biosynthesis tyrosine autokinase [Phycisphaerae bacterium]
MNDLIRYHDNDQVIEQNIVSFESPPESYGESTSNLMLGILRRWPIVFLVFILIGAIGIPAIWFLVEPLHTVAGAIKVEPILENILTGEGDRGLISNYQNYMNTQAILITSNEIVQGAADYLVDKNLSFFSGEPTNPVMKIKQKIMNTRKSTDIAEILKQAISDEIITVAPVDRTELITITMKSSESKEAQQIVDAFIRSYMAKEGRGLTREQNRKLQLLNDERSSLENALITHQEQIRLKAKPYGTPSPADGNDILQRQRITLLYAELAKLESREINLKTQVELLKEFPEQGIEPEEMIRIRNEYVNSNPAVQELTRTIIQLERDLIMAQQNLSVENPALRQKQELIDAFQLRLKDEREEAEKEFDLMVLKEAINASIVKRRTAEAELTQTEKHKERLKNELADENIVMVRVGNTQLEIRDYQYAFERDKKMYDQVTRRIQELQMEQKRPARIYVAYFAEIGPGLDKRMKYIMALLFGALASGVLLASLINKLDLRLQKPDDVSKSIGLRIIGTTTSSHNIKPYLLPEQIAGDYQTIRTNLGLINDEGIPRKLVVTSPGMREGKTTFSVNLATSMSRAGKKVLLIDGNLRKPDVAQMLGIPEGSRYGLQDVLLGEEFDNAVYTMPSTGLDVLIADSQSRINDYELLASPGTRQCIDMLSQYYDHVIIDTTPILAFPDALIWARLGDAVILVSYAGYTTTTDLKEAKDRLTRINVKVLGTVLSNVQSEYSYFRSDMKRDAQKGKSRGGIRRGKRKPSVNMQSMEDNTDDSTTTELNQQVED